ncbi:hypothetical protein GIB67_009173 [Kingdonia uniflora]|uniref:Isopenicillin N synthase-like Fe(2+) 2OG dioxygenase domain-containing protein n=1 Tax=Kingdonia uniflora TaxID=39325 RepID=A0A7J7N2D6_9MAGN|nr:hypothetical protein GIB67_009173 [Kingdonia uniflora]
MNGVILVAAVSSRNYICCCWLPVQSTVAATNTLWESYLQAWTSGRLHSAHHRVIMIGKDSRYSAGLFSIPKAGYMINAPEELVDEDHPLLFKPFDFFGLLRFSRSEEGQRAKFLLETYCGV